MPCLKIAHRGAAGTRPELTQPAFERALEIGVDMIELDVQLTRDQHLVVLHDRELGRTVQGEGAVREHTPRRAAARSMPAPGSRSSTPARACRRSPRCSS